MSEVKRYHFESFIDSYYKHRQFVLASDYDALAAKLTMAEDAAAKGDAARQQCGGMEMEIEELRAELAELRARVVVLPSVDNVMNIVMRYQWNEKTNVTGTTNWAANLGMRVVEEVKRLNGKTVSDGLLREVARHLGNWLELHECECDGGFHYCGRDQVAKTNRELRALLNQDKENGNG
ncbi:hypothetical protein [Pseudomonas aeruginosa]|uniref:hypothetical protein n=1 Tax=Pseudomonas aeruginosa TaxID=287 RepID=UPI002A755049|nr:hypothetical protein [Pseudomonas aeruginosa]MDY1584199.1 hypothetical protein [Pseudomonas aeruginosa]HCE5817596.1 hypothetical protein [Pseudomonas aeruginosa]